MKNYYFWNSYQGLLHVHRVRGEQREILVFERDSFGWQEARMKSYPVVGNFRNALDIIESLVERGGYYPLVPFCLTL